MGERLKIVVVGDGAVGKTAMLLRFTRNEFLRGYEPTTFDNYTITVPVKEQPYEVVLFDTAGQEAYQRLRQLAYPGTNIFIIAFSVDRPESFSHVTQVWKPELSVNRPGVPFVLIGAKVDLRDDPQVIEKLAKVNKKPITYSEGKKLARKLKAACYCECSSLTNEGVQEAFLKTIEYAALHPEGKSKCHIL